ncbi:hypothetical protein [Mycoplasmopsis cynos]|uniref:hypothetical protein n=1 Tax=Mycoplasmopsis cynos TaxID=171284 RepID=UPI0024CA28B8|nr:hypothetical protein [Mycoplasmopsis cynos]WAM07271.1 hypothetical protein ONA21_03495 [Mycoplasmopsis cynos]
MNENKNEPWLVEQELLKSNAFEKNGELKDVLFNEKALHIRKLQKFIFGANGDTKEENNDLIEKLKNYVLEDQKNGNEVKVNQAYDEVFRKAKEFATKYSNNVPSDEILKNVTKKHLNIFLNAPLLELQFQAFLKILNSKIKIKLIANIHLKRLMQKFLNLKVNQHLINF